MPRSDAARNRERLLAAAEDVFREHGAQAALDLVVQRAGVGRATLYRHFADREALVSALCAARVDALEDLAARHTGPDLLDRLLTEIWQVQQEFPGLFVVLLGSDAGRRDLRTLSDRTRTTMERGVGTARSAGTLHPDVTVDTVMQVLVMLPGAATASAGPEHERLRREVLDVVLRGLRTEG